MKQTKIIYWVFTGLMTAFLLLGSFLDLSHDKEAEALIAHLGYPLYFVTFIGVVRLLGVVAVLVPGFPIVKEWAYAGLVFDMLGAIYSHIATGDPIGAWMPAFIGLVLVVGSYIFYHRKSGTLFLQNPVLKS